MLCVTSGLSAQPLPAPHTAQIKTARALLGKEQAAGTTPRLSCRGRNKSLGDEESQGCSLLWGFSGVSYLG